MFAFLAESGTYRSANIMIVNKTPCPPPKKDSARQHEKEFFGGLSRSLRTRALAGKILTFLTCMPAGDSKNEPHQEKSLLSSFSVGAQSHGNTHCSQGRQDSIAQMQRRLCSASARAQPRKDKKKTTIKIQMVFSFPPEERVPFSQPRKDGGARVATARGRLLSSSGRLGWDNTTIKKEQ